MTNEELDKARVKEAQRLFLDGSDESPTTVIAARLAREGWMPPAAVDPDVGSIWEHYNGNVYEVIAIANTLDTEKYPKAVIHKNRANGTVWTRRADDWHRSYTQQAKASEPPPVAVYPDIAEAKKIADDWAEAGLSFWDLALAGIKRGRALAAEAKPGMVWVKHDGSRKNPLDRRNSWILVNRAQRGFGAYYSSNDAMLDWRDVTHYAVITPFAEAVA